MDFVKPTGNHKPLIMKVRTKRQGMENHDEDYDYYNHQYSHQDHQNIPIQGGSKNSRHIFTDNRQYIPNDNSYLSSSSADNKLYEYDYTNIEPPPPYYNDTFQSINMTNNTEIGHTLHVKGAEVVIVLLVLLLWVGAIALFFHRWGKIRMLEPYQPKFCEAHRLSCPMAEIDGVYPRSHSRDLSPHFAKCNYHGIGIRGSIGGFGPGTSGLAPGNFANGTNNRPRQNSVFVTSVYSTGMAINGSLFKNASRRTKSALDLSTLVLSEEFQENVRRNSKNSVTHL